MPDNIKQYKEELVSQIFGANAAAAPNANVLSSIPLGNNIVGIGYGAKVTVGAVVAEEEALRVYVRTKLAQGNIPPGETIPTTVNGLPTDVIAVGDITAAVRPAPGGSSIGHKNITAGTLGCLVRKIGTPAPVYILSNNHVLADVNKGIVSAPALGVLGDEILEPGRADGGALPAGLIARLTDFAPIALLAFNAPPSPTPNLMDCAIAEVVNLTDVRRDLMTIGPVASPTTPAALYQSVRKSGRTTGHTIGVVMDVSASVRVAYGVQVADFDDQIAIIGAGGPFGAGGDSGALIVDARSKQATGLLFAVGGATTFANPIDVVLTHFGVEIL